jgi:hypothetical protein
MTGERDADGAGWLQTEAAGRSSAWKQPAGAVHVQRRIAALPGGDEQRQRSLPLLTGARKVEPPAGR